MTSNFKKSVWQLSTIALACVTPAMLGGCIQGGTQPELTYRMHPVKVAESVERLELYARPEGLVLSTKDEYAVSNFLRTYAAEGSGPIYINRPAAALTGQGVVQTDALLQRLMGQSGISSNAAQSGTYHTRPGDPAPVVISYRTLRAISQDCSSLGDLSSTHRNSVTPEFGCHASANLAAMISDPRQLIEPYATQASNAQRRQVVYDRYIEGVSTGSEKPAGQAQSSQDSGG